MTFKVRWVQGAQQTYLDLEERASAAFQRRKAEGIKKSTPVEGLFKQVRKTIENLQQNPKHPGLKTHEYHAMANPVRQGEKVWEAYAQNRTPGAYRIFWVYGLGQNEITIIAITPHP